MSVAQTAETGSRSFR